MASAPQPIDMSHPSRWLATLRIIIGLYFVKALWTKLTLTMVGGILPVPVVSQRWIEVMPKIVERQASENPILFYKAFLENTVLTHGTLFAQLTAWGEVIVGIGLTFGLLNGLAALVGLWLTINYGLATQWMSPNSFGFHLVLVAAMLVFFLARAGRALGIDAWLAWRFPNSWVTRRPWS